MSAAEHREWQTGDRAAIGKRLYAQLVKHKTDKAAAQFLAAERGEAVLLYDNGTLAKLVVELRPNQLRAGTLPWEINACAWRATDNLFALQVDAAPYSALEILGVRGVYAFLARRKMRFVAVTNV